MCGQWIVRCKCRIVNWKYVTVGFGRLKFDMADVVCVCGQRILRCKYRIGRIKSNEELIRLTGNKNIINYIKAQKLAWFGNVHRMPDNSMVKKNMSDHPH